MADKKARLIELDIHRRKLMDLVGELLRKADELDQASKGARDNAAKLSRQWHDQLAATCADLASLSQAGARVEPLIKSGKVSAAEQALLRCAKIANHLSARLNELKRQL